MKSLAYAFLAVFFFPFIAASQPFTITGTVVDTLTKEPVVNALIKLQSFKDTSISYSGISLTDGSFSITTTQGKGFRLTIRSLGYEMKSLSVMAERKSALGNIYLKPSTKVLDEVEVVGVSQRAIQKGDTTQFLADSYKTNPDATAEDLIKKMPGVTVEGGTVKAQGEEVKRVMVDGKPFFGDDPKTALKNLPAQAVEKIEVFDRKSDQSQFTGFNDGDDQKTINIITRPAFRNGTFGRVYAGYGTDDRYQAGGNINQFKDNQRISIVGMTNNINEQNFGNQDLLGVVGTSANTQRGVGPPRWMRGPTVESDPNDFRVGAQSGINTSNSFGVNYSDEWKKIKLNASYFFNNTSNRTEQLIGQTFFLTDTTNQFYNSSVFGNSNNMNHRFNLRMEYKIDDKNTIFFTPSANLQSNDGFSQNDATTTSSTNTLLNSSRNQYSSDLSGYNLNGDLLWQYKFDKKGRTFSINLRGSANENDGTSELLAVNTFYKNMIAINDSIAQEGFPVSKGSRMGTRSRFTEPIGEKGQIEIGHDYNRNIDDSQKETYNFDPDTRVYTSLDTNLSNVFKSVYEANKFGASYRLRGEKITGGVGLDYQYATLESDLQFPRSGDIFRSFSNFLPNAMLMYQISKQKNLRVFYRTSTNEPGVTQLQDVVNNSNPLQLSIGNPNLKQSYSNRMFFRYSSTNTEKASNFFVMGWIRQTSNMISNATLIATQDTLIGDSVLLNQGSLLRYPVNLNGQWMTGVNLTWGLPVAPLKSNLNISTGINYNRTPGLINQQDNMSQTLGFTQGFTLASNFSDKVDFNVSFNANVNLVNNTLQPELNNNYYIQTSGIGLNYIFWKGVVFRTSLNHQWYAGLGDEFNQNFMLWNASIGKKLFKNDQGEISLQVFDLLNQNQSISRTVTEAYVQDLQTLVLQQYFMLTFTWNIKAFKES